MYLELNDDFLEKNDIFHVDEYTTEALWEIIKIVQEDCEELEVGHPRRLLPQKSVCLDKGYSISVCSLYMVEWYYHFI